MNKKTTSLTWGLYNISPRYPFVWLKYAVKDTIILFKRIGFLLRHGYPEQMRWETFSVLNDMLDDVFHWYLYERNSDIPIEGVEEEDYQEENDKLFMHLLELLEVMRNEDDYWDEAYAAKDEFFDLMKKYYYHLWD